MSRQHHYLKTETAYYQAVEKGLKKFELRKNDRNFQVQDWLHLEETVDGTKTGRTLNPIEIKYIFHGGRFGLAEDYCILSF